MKFVSVRDFRSNPAQLWRDLRKEQELVVTHNGKPIGLLTPVSAVNFEETLAAVRRAIAIQSVQKMRMEAQKSGLHKMTSEEIAQEIKAHRKTAP